MYNRILNEWKIKVFKCWKIYVREVVSERKEKERIEREKKEEEERRILEEKMAIESEAKKQKLAMEQQQLKEKMKQYKEEREKQIKSKNSLDLNLDPETLTKLAIQEEIRQQNKKEQMKIMMDELNKNLDEYILFILFLSLFYYLFIFVRTEKEEIRLAEEDVQAYINSKEGKKIIQKEAERILEDINNPKVVKTCTFSGTKWKRLYDKMDNLVIYSNDETGEKIMSHIEVNRANDLAKELLYGSLFHKASLKIKAHREGSLRIFKKLYCVELIESIWAIHKAHLILHEKMKEIWVKRHVLGKVKPFYYNINTYEKRWTKPHLLGKSEATELSKYVILQDDKCNYQYCSLISKWKSQKKPDGVMLCMKCNFNFGNLYCKECHFIYCFDCFEEVHPDEYTKWHEKSFFETKKLCCLICNSLASYVCPDDTCFGSAYCRKCVRLMHNRPQTQFHKYVPV